MSLERVYKYIDDNMDRFIDEFREFLKIPSVAATGECLEEAADYLEDLMKKSGIKTVQRFYDGGPAVLIGSTPKGEEYKTLLCYGHYDVQPADPFDQWLSPPFAAEIRDGVIYARGATDNKGGVMAFLKAQEAFNAVMEGAPLNLKYIFEGEEEIGSPHLDQFCINHGDLIKADGMHCLDGGVTPSKGVPDIDLGLKGILYVELVSEGPKFDVYSGAAALVDNPVWHLVHVLNTLLDKDGNILIDGWFDDYLPPTEEDLELIRKEVEESDENDVLKHLGVKKFGYGRNFYNALRERQYGATCTICGIYGGYTGKGAKTIVPASATAKIDFRLPPNLNPQRQLERLRTYLDKCGFEDIKIVCHTNRGFPYKVPLSNDLAQSIIEAATEIFGAAPAVHGLTQEDIIKHYVEMPVVLTGFGPADCNLHSPNENMSIEYFNKGIKYAALIMDKFARR